MSNAAYAGGSQDLSLPDNRSRIGQRTCRLNRSPAPARIRFNSAPAPVAPKARCLQSPALAALRGRRVPALPGSVRTPHLEEAIVLSRRAVGCATRTQPGCHKSSDALFAGLLLRNQRAETPP